MPIRCSSKAILMLNGRILLNRCRDRGEVYYDLPGGGQHLFESMEEAVRREVMEETGYSVVIDRFAAVAEEITADPLIRTQYPEYAHRILHIFLAHPADAAQQATSETDYQQEASVWVTPEVADALPMRPSSMTGQFRRILEADSCVFLNTAYD